MTQFNERERAFVGLGKQRANMAGRASVADQGNGIAERYHARTRAFAERFQQRTSIETHRALITRDEFAEVAG